MAIVALALGQGDAGAQAQPAQLPPAQDATALPAGTPINLSPTEQLAQADAALARMDGARGSVRRQLETARAARDVVKTLCLNDKLNQMDVAIRSAGERRQALEASAVRGDNEQASHDFTILAVLRQRSDQLTAEANQCIGQEAGYIGESAVTSTIDPNLPDEESPTAPPHIGVIADIPPCSSCFK